MIHVLTLLCVFPRGRGAGRGVRCREEEVGFPGEVAGSSREEVTLLAPYPGVEVRRGNSVRTRLQQSKIKSSVTTTNRFDNAQIPQFYLL